MAKRNYNTYWNAHTHVHSKDFDTLPSFLLNQDAAIEGYFDGEEEYRIDEAIEANRYYDPCGGDEW